MKTEHTDRNWIIVRIDGKIAGISTDYRTLASVSARLSQAGDKIPYKEITATTTDFEEVWRLRQEVGWDDLLLFGMAGRSPVGPGMTGRRPGMTGRRPGMTETPTSAW